MVRLRSTSDAPGEGPHSLVAPLLSGREDGRGISGSEQRQLRRNLTCNLNASQLSKFVRHHSFSDTATAPVVERAPVRLYLSERDPCVCRLHVNCIDQVGILLTLSDLLTRHGLDVDTADIAVVGNCVDNRFIVRAPRPTDFADAMEWCRELEDSVKQSLAGGASQGWGDMAQNGREAAQAAAERLAVNPHLLCVSRFQALPSAGRAQKRYRLELKGINQAGLLAYMSMVLSLSFFSIRRAHISTKEGQITDVFELVSFADDAPERLKRFLHLPAATESPSSDRFSLMWKGDSPGFDDDSLREVNEDAIVTFRTVPDFLSGPNPPSTPPASQIKERLHFPNGDVYEGALVAVPTQPGDSNSGCQHRHGYGVYTYADDKAMYLRYAGQWSQNAKHGFGTLLLRDGSAYVGQWRDNQRHGLGVMFGYGPNGASGQAAMPTYRYEGEWLNDKPDGIGVQETDDSLYCGRFKNGAFSERGLKSSLRKPGVAGCTVLCDGQWRPLTELLAEDPVAVTRRSSSKKGAMHPVQQAMLASSRANSPQPGCAAEDLAAAQTVHFGTRGAKASRPALSAISFGSGGGAQEEAAAATAAGRDDGKAAGKEEREIVMRMTISPPCEERGATGASSTSASTADMATPLLSCNYAGRGGGHQLASSSPGDSDEQRTAPFARVASASALLQAAGEQEPSAPQMQRSSSGASVAAVVGAAPTPETPRATASSGAQRRARTPEGRSEAHVIACPMLWSEVELATVVACLGVKPAVVRRLLGAPGGHSESGSYVSEEPMRVGGASQILEMTNAQLGKDLELTAPMERTVVRRALGHLMDADRRANYHRRGLRDVMENPALRKFVIPMERLTLEGTICQGGFGIVYRGVLKPSQPEADAWGGMKKQASMSDRPQVVAVKEMLGDHRVRLHELLKEANVMASLKHNNICRFIGICADSNPRGKRFILSELLHCSLFDLVHRPTRVPYSGELDIPLTLKLCEGICAGLSYIHDRSLVHADLKSSNILIDLALRPEDEQRPVPKICDFGHAAVRISSSPHDRLCTPHWAAPEVLRNEGLGPVADMFSVGVLLWEMLAKQVPHHDLGFGQVLAAVGWAGAVPDMELLPPGLPEEIRRLLDDLLRFMPLERPSSRERIVDLSVCLGYSDGEPSKGCWASSGAAHRPPEVYTGSPGLQKVPLLDQGAMAPVACRVPTFAAGDLRLARAPL
eukprot:CAMPEP_0176069450 /NCGR_PEP_ID=MMETSP0120_2-20121206/34677_1 /TAXON_ID=160619 /ORGANISM="Kryptoperidinium foliaceum, Strain CCMP 1326" /LENGTH=1204 /DNA_ID=CAMNT_0017403087 /DNA_START=62 /DNA_END=3673 /DNA_ORIENTATION=+